LHLLTAEWLPIKWYFCFFNAPKSGEAELFSKGHTEFLYYQERSLLKIPLLISPVQHNKHGLAVFSVLLMGNCLKGNV